MRCHSSWKAFFGPKGVAPQEGFHCIHIIKPNLDFSNRITRDGMKQLAKLLKKDTALEVLDLSYNRLEDDGAVYLAEAIATFNTNLHT